MEQQTLFELLVNLFIKVQIFLTRPQVVTQLLAIAAVVVLLGGLSLLLSFLVSRSVRRDEEATQEPTAEQQVSFGRRLLLSVTLLVFPALALFATNYLMMMMQADGRVVGLLDFLMRILWVLLAYRLFLAVLYLLFKPASVKRFQTRLLTPLFSLFVIYSVLGLFLDINTLTNAILTDLSENPVTFGALLFATVGLYFWVNGIWSINEVILAIANRSQSVNTGRLEASLALIAYVLIGVGVFVGLGQLGIDSTTFAAITAGLSVGIGFGLQAIIVNFISGILLLFEGTIKPGDYIMVDGKWAEVEKLSIRATYIHNWHGEQKIVPNQKFINSNIINFSASGDWYRYKTHIRVRSQEDPMTIKALLKTFAQEDERVRGQPDVRLVNFDDLGMEFRLRYWINPRLNWADFVEDFYVFLIKEFGKNNLQISIPRQDVFVHGSNDAWQVLQSAASEDHSLPPLTQ